jgi:hypothetical protein
MFKLWRKVFFKIIFLLENTIKYLFFIFFIFNIRTSKLLENTKKLLI